MLVVSARPAAMPTFDDIQRGMYDTYRALEHYQDAWDFAVQKGSGPAIHQSFTRKIDKDRVEFVVGTNGLMLARQVHDGQKLGIMVATSRQYATQKAANDEHDKPFDKADRPALEDNSFNYYVKEYDVAFVSKPQFVVTKDEAVQLDGAKAREITAVAKRTDGSATLNLHYWFGPDKWILRHVELDIHSAAAGDFTIRGNLIKIDFNAKVVAGDFILKPDDIAGYQEVPMSQIKTL